VSQEHDGVALALSPTVETLQGGGFSKDERALIDKDELRVFDMLTPNFSFYCTETVLKDGKFGEYGIFRFLARKPELSRETFTTRFEGAHADVVRAALDASVVRYALDRPAHEPAHPRFPFEAISDAWFASEDDAVRALREPAIARDLAEFCDLDRSVTMLTHAFRRREQ
jgi:hypothetical protein